MKLVSYSDTEDEDEPPLVTLDSDSAALIKPPTQPLISLDSDSAALIKPVRPNNKDICPPNFCQMKKANKRSWWVQCSGVECGQWYHQRCVGVTRKVAERDDFICPKCR